MFSRSRTQKTTMLYHGVSAMAMKGLQDMGANIGGSDDQSFSQLPTQSVRVCFVPCFVRVIRAGALCPPAGC
jgi:hypothetical protein